MHQSWLIFVFCFLLIVSSSGTKYETKTMQYSVPKATITAFQSKGFSVSIPDSPGVSLFAFHGNINSQLASLEGGTFSKDVLKPENGLWTFQDTSTKLKVGDVVNYWLFVEKDGLGYRQDLQKFVVKDLYNDIESVAEGLIMEGTGTDLKQSTILSGDIHHYHHYYNETSSAAQCQVDKKSDEYFDKISNQLNVVLMQLKSLHDKTEPLKGKFDSLEEVIGELLKNEDNETKLLLIGNKPPHDTNVYEAVRGVITDRLDLYDLSSSIKFAESVSGGIMFEVKNSIEKHRILIRARERFNTEKGKIVEYCFHDDGKSNAQVPEIFHRTGDEEKSTEHPQSDIVDRFLFE